MGNGLLKSIADHLILGLTILLIFLLILDPWLSIPDLAVFAGRLHPVILHFPIVLIVLTVLNSFTKSKHHQDILLPVTVLFTLITALTGFLLSEENAVKGDLLISHQWMGSAVAILMFIWYTAGDKKWISPLFSGTFRLSIVLLIIFTGHYGGMITHGQNFLSWTTDKPANVKPLPEDPLVFEDLVLPVVEAKCAGCHNADKSKGGLILTDFAGMLNGGESGPSLMPGDPGQSEMIKRIHLPVSDEDHMPPEDQDQLTRQEIALLEGWIAAGGGENMRVALIEETDPFYEILQPFLIPASSARWIDLPEIDESLIESLSSDYYTIRRLAENSNALAVLVLPHPGYTDRRLSPLQPVIDNIVELDLSYLPLEEEEMKFISRCSALEWLEIDFTPVDDAKFSQLEVLENLRVLKAQGSKLSGKSNELLMKFKNLKKLYLWDTGIPEELLAGIRDQRPELVVNTGIDRNISFTSRLPVPNANPSRHFFTDPFELQFELPLKGIDVYYAFNEKQPVEEGTLYSHPVLIDKSCTIRYMASKEGWQDSPVDSMLIFKTINKPDSVRLVELPDPKYPGRGELSLFDLNKGPLIPQDSAWLGFQQNKMILHCRWNHEVKLSGITFSSLVNTGIHIFPPSHIEVRGGNEQEQHLLGTLNTAPMAKNEGAGFRYFTCTLKQESFTHLEITVTPLEKLPEWHNEKGKPGWFFIDEVILEE
jgi:hypothetical protein